MIVSSSNISVVIPALEHNSALDDLVENLTHDSITQIIVVFPISTELQHSTKQYGDRVQFLEAVKGRGGQIQTGIEQSSEDIIFILHADSGVKNADIGEIFKILSISDVALGSFRLQFDRDCWPAKLFAWFTRFDSVFTTFGDQGFFFRRTDFLAAKIDLTENPLMEDVILRRALRRTGRVQKANSCITTSTQRLEKLGFWRGQWINFTLIIQFMFGVNSQQLYRKYYGDPGGRIPLRNHRSNSKIENSEGRVIAETMSSRKVRAPLRQDAG